MKWLSAFIMLALGVGASVAVEYMAGLRSSAVVAVVAGVAVTLLCREILLTARCQKMLERFQRRLHDLVR